MESRRSYPKVAGLAVEAATAAVGPLAGPGGG